MSENHSELASPFVDAKHRQTMLLVRFVRPVQNGFMQCVAQTLTCLVFWPKHDVRTFRAQFSRIAPTVLLRRRRHKRRRHRPVMELGTRFIVSSLSEPSRRAQLKQRPFV